MVPAPCEATAAVPPPAYHRAQAKRRGVLHWDALTLVRRLHLLALCRVAVRLAQQRCPPPLPAAPAGWSRWAATPLSRRVARAVRSRAYAVAAVVSGSA